MLGYSALAVTATEAQSYIDARLLTGWHVGLPEQNAALRRGQDYIAREFNHRWLISFDDTNSPDIVKYAIVEAALMEVKTPGVLSPMVTAASAKILTEVKGIKWTPVAAKIGGSSAANAMKPVLTNVEMMLASIARPLFFPVALVV